MLKSNIFKAYIFFAMQPASILLKTQIIPPLKNANFVLPKFRI